MELRWRRAASRRMRLTRCYTDQPLAPGRTVALDEAAARHLVRVLRMSAGDTVVLFNGDGSDYRAQLTTADKRQAAVRIEARMAAAAEPALRVTLLQAVARGERMDWALQKATELGVAAIRPLLTERVEVRLDAGRLHKRMRHWHRIIVSACEQSGRAVLPELHRPAPLAGDGFPVLPDPCLALDAAAPPGLRAAVAKATECGLVVGPEGGLTGAEYAELVRRGARRVGLGPRTLRTETAGPAALAALLVS